MNKKLITLLFMGSVALGMAQTVQTQPGLDGQQQRPEIFKYYNWSVSAYSVGKYQIGLAQHGSSNIIDSVSPPPGTKCDSIWPFHFPSGGGVFTIAGSYISCPNISARQFDFMKKAPGGPWTIVPNKTFSLGDVWVFMNPPCCSTSADCNGDYTPGIIAVQPCPTPTPSPSPGDCFNQHIGIDMAYNCLTGSDADSWSDDLVFEWDCWLCEKQTTHTMPSGHIAYVKIRTPSQDHTTPWLITAGVTPSVCLPEMTLNPIDILGFNELSEGDGNGQAMDFQVTTSCNCQYITNAVIATPGSGHYVGELLPPAYGTQCPPSVGYSFRLQVTSVDVNGGVTGVVIVPGIGYTVPPSNPVQFPNGVTANCTFQ